MSAKMTCPAGSLSMAELQDFYYKAVGVNVYMKSKVSIVNGKYIIGCILDIVNDKVRMFSLMNKEEVIHVSNITGVEVLPAFTVESKLNALKSYNSAYIKKYEFPTNENGYDGDTLFEQMMEITRAVNKEGCTWFGKVYTVNDNEVTFIGFKKGEAEQLVFDATPIYLDDISEIRIERNEKSSLSPTKLVNQNGQFDAAMETMAGKEVGEGGKNTMNGWQSYVVDKFSDVGELVSITTKNGRDYVGHIRRYDDAGGEAVMIVEISQSYGSKAIGNAHVIRVSEISSITYTEKKVNSNSPESYFIQ